MSNRRSPLRVPSVRGTVPLELAFRKDQEPDVGKSSLSTSVVFLAGSHERSPRSGGASGEFAPLSPRVDPGGGFKAESNRDRAYFARALNRDTNQSARARITTSIVAASTTSERSAPALEN